MDIDTRKNRGEIDEILADYHKKIYCMKYLLICINVRKQAT
jgi:hypothetical protein